MAVECFELRDERTGSRARVLSGFGFNCFSFQVPHRGSLIELLWATENFAGGQERASSSGIPLLFPFPGRLAGTEFSWEGNTYPLQAGDGRGNAIHGFVLDRRWRVIEQAADRVTGQFHASLDAPELLNCWPADFRITVNYQLTGNALRSELRIENPDDKPLPYGLGTHPYFRLPLGGDSADSCRVTLPVRKRWELREMLPTGQILTVADAEQYQAGLRFADMQFDDVFTDLVFVDGKCVSTLDDPEARARLSLEFDSSFHECVVYTPPHREAICIEPYTCLPGVLEVLAPGAAVRHQVDIVGPADD